MVAEDREAADSDHAPWRRTAPRASCNNDEPMVDVSEEIERELQTLKDDLAAPPESLSDQRLDEEISIIV
jgi:hypothetical protein